MRGTLSGWPMRMTAICLSFLLVLPAEAKTISLSKDAPAPWSGILLDPETAAKLKARIEILKMELEYMKQWARQVESQARQGERRICELRMREITKNCQDSINIVSKHTPWWVWVAVGIGALGIGVGIGAVVTR